MYIGVVVNPFARKNRGMPANRSAALRRIVGPWGEVHETASIDDLRGIVAGLYPRASHLVSDGGDGALHWLINEMPQRDRDPQRWPTFVPTNGGAIDFVARKAGVRGRADTVLSALTAAAQ
ncbi:MAG TPA: retinol dehydrogenase, partial [Mycobacterium sp.]|nr:retinol dehydrogenase [Mycobacterium sp.]